MELGLAHGTPFSKCSIHADPETSSSCGVKARLKLAFRQSASFPRTPPTSSLPTTLSTYWPNCGARRGRERMARRSSMVLVQARSGAGRAGLGGTMPECAVRVVCRGVGGVRCGADLAPVWGG